MKPRSPLGANLHSTPSSAQSSNSSATYRLRTEGLSKHWGEFVANSAISLDIRAGARHAIIGPNGAGKTTLINLLTGALPPTAGRIYLGEHDITQVPQHRRVKLGLTRTFQINTLFAGLSVLASVLLVITERRAQQFAWYRTLSVLREEIDEAMTLLESLKLASVAQHMTRTLPYGKQRLLEIALALATRPSVLLLDEPAAGIPVAESAALFEVMLQLPREMSIIFIEHDMGLVFRYAETITVLVGGAVLAEGTPAAIAADPRVKEVYLGEAEYG